MPRGLPPFMLFLQILVASLAPRGEYRGATAGSGGGGTAGCLRLGLMYDFMSSQ